MSVVSASTHTDMHMVLYVYIRTLMTPLNDVSIYTCFCGITAVCLYICTYAYSPCVVGYMYAKFLILLCM